MANWWEFPVTQGYGVNGEQGVDFGTPIGTPITSLFSGVVESVGYGAWGGLVTALVQTPQGPLTEYALHLDSIAVKPGDPITPASVFGLSGGQLSGGQHPAQQPYSNGPHLEYGFFQGSAFASASVDPQPIIDAAKGPAGATLLASKKGPCDGLTGPQWLECVAFNNIPQPTRDAAAAASSTATAVSGLPTTIGHGIADALAVGSHDVGVFLHRQVIALFVAALVLLVLFRL